LGSSESKAGNIVGSLGIEIFEYLRPPNHGLDTKPFPKSICPQGGNRQMVDVLEEWPILREQPKS
jgi:hypothetical protein